MTDLPTMRACTSCGQFVHLEANVAASCPKCGLHLPQSSGEPSSPTGSESPWWVNRASEGKPTSSSSIVPTAPVTSAPIHSGYPTFPAFLAPIPSEPALVNERSSSTATGWLVPSVVGALIGLTLFVPLSLARPTIGLGGFLVMAILALAFCGIQLWTRRYAVGRTESGWFSAARRCPPAVAFVMTVAVGVEATAPQSGLIRSVWAKRDEGQTETSTVAERVAKPAPEANARPSARAWREADFILVNPTELAVAVRREGESGTDFRVVGKAEGETTRAAKRTAWNAGTPILAHNPDIARRIHARSEVGDLLGEELAKGINRDTKFVPLLPESAKLMHYYDTVNQLRRVGHLVKDSGERFEFVDLLAPTLPRNQNPGFGFRSEVIERTKRVRAGSEAVELNDLSLKATVDTLDYFLYQTLKALNEKDTGLSKGPPCLFVDQVFADLEGWGGLYTSGYMNGTEVVRQDRKKYLDDAKASLTEHRNERNQDIFSGDKKLSWSLAELAVQAMTRDRRGVNDPARRRELDAEIAIAKRQIELCKYLVQEENRLTAQIQSKLSATGVRLVERSERAKSIYRNQVSLRTWVASEFKADQGFTKKPFEIVGDTRKKPARVSIVSASDGFDEAPGQYDTLEGSGAEHATHLLLVDIRRPENESVGKYELAMRVVSVQTMQILWADQGDRFGRESISASLVASFLPTTPSQPLLTGLWASDKNDRLRISEDANGAVSVFLVSSPNTSGFQLRGKRTGNSVSVESSSLTVAVRGRDIRRDIRAEMKVIDDDTVEINHQMIELDKAGRAIPGRMSGLCLKRKE